MPRLRSILLICLAGCCRAAPTTADVETLFHDALAAEAQLDSRRALALFLEVEKERPRDAFLLQKIARQYSDLVVELGTTAEKKNSTEQALAYARRAVELDPKSAVNVLSLAICHGKLGLYSDTRAKVEYSRLVRDEAEQALALDSHYAWAHHVLGRWHYEVSTLGLTARVFVRFFYGGLPPASTSEAVRLLSRAVELEPDELEHQLELGFACLADGQPGRARAAFTKGLAMPSRAKFDEPAKERARAALKAL